MAEDKPTLEATEIYSMGVFNFIYSLYWIVIVKDEVYFFEKDEAEIEDGKISFETEKATIVADENVVKKGKWLRLRKWL